jgi:hypothetical protein
VVPSAFFFKRGDFMAIAQDTIITVGTGATAKTFGVSKSLDNYTLDDLKTIADWSFSAYQDNLWNANFFDGGYNRTAQIWDTGRSAAVHLYKFPTYNIYIEGSKLTGKLFTRNILIYCNTAVNWAGANIYHGLSTLSRYHVVTDIEIQDLKLNLGNNPDTVVTSMPTCKLGINDVRICPMQLIIDEEDNIYLCLIQNWNGAQGGAGNRQSQLAMRGISYDNVEIAYYNYGTGNNGMKTIEGTLNKVLGPSGIDFALHTAGSDEVYTTGTEPVKVERTSGGGYNYFKYTLQSANTEAPYLTFAYAGIRFNDGTKDYKPIVENGMITGYTDDDSVTSEFDSWTSIKDHVTPSRPPSPTPPGPSYDDDPWSGASFSGVGVGGAGAFAKCYYMTSTELANLRSWMNSNNVPEGFDPMAQIIGLSQVPVSLSGDDNTTVQFVNSSAVYDPGVTRVVDSGVNTQISMGTPKKYSLGSVDIVRRMQERGEPYLDYDCQIELYLPLIGMFSLDTQAVMGRTITAEAVIDPISGTLAAYAYVSKDGQNLPIAYGSTTIGVDLPISAQQYSVSRAALKQANAQLGTSLLSSTLSLIAAATAGGKGSGTGAKTATGTTNGLAAAGIREAGADYMKASQAGNVFGDFMQWGRTIRQLSYGNNTAISGSFGGSTAQWSYPFTPYVKINRPRYEKPSNYNHSQGVPCVQTKTVGSCTGFIQCIGVDVSGITGATDIELQAIQAALTNGVFAGGGS